MEPPTNAKVLLQTTFGPIEIQLWGKEAPKAVRNFLTMCLQGFYDDTQLDKLVPDCYIQTTKKSSSYSIYGCPFVDQFNSKLKFSKRGMVAMDNQGKPNNNTTAFFMTFAECPWLDKKHTIIGRVAGRTIFNLLAMQRLQVQGNKPTYPPKIISTEVVVNPYKQLKCLERGGKMLEERVKQELSKRIQNNRVKKPKGYQGTDRKVLSFQCEEDAQIQSRVKNSHDILQDPLLLKQNAPQREVQAGPPEEKGKLKVSQRLRQFIRNDQQLVQKEQLDREQPARDRATQEIKEHSQNQQSSESSESQVDEQIKMLRLKQQASIREIKQGNLFFKQTAERRTDLSSLLSNAEKRRIYIDNKRLNAARQQQVHEKLEQFQRVVQEGRGWLQHRLRFAVDAQKAFKQQQLRGTLRDINQ